MRITGQRWQPQEKAGSAPVRPLQIVPASAQAIEHAVDLLRRGELVGMPTETVYGLAADATSGNAVARVYEAKGRPQFNPLIAHVASVEQAVAEAAFDVRALELANRFWPGPLTIVARAHGNGSVCELARAGQSTVALRVPNHPVALDLIRALGRPIAAPSANLSGRISPTCAADVITELGERVALVIDAGACTVGVESTIVAVLPDEPVYLLRPGGITREALLEVVADVADSSGHGIDAPGQSRSHYAPRARVRLNADAPRAGEAFLAFGDTGRSGDENLSSSGDLREAAANLFGLLRKLDARGVAGSAVAPSPARGLGVAINDRLRRAAAGDPATPA